MDLANLTFHSGTSKKFKESPCDSVMGNEFKPKNRPSDARREQIDLKFKTCQNFLN